MRNGNSLLAEAGVGLISGYVGTKVMEPVSMRLYEWEPQEARRREDEVRPGPPYKIAAEKTARLAGVHLEGRPLEMAAMGFHYGLGMSWGVVYEGLRAATGMNPVAAGLLTGAAMSLIVDEGMTPLLGFSAPNRAYPFVTHARGFVAHLAFGLGVAASAEAIRWLGRGTWRPR
jgi:hypothetical protein